MGLFEKIGLARKKPRPVGQQLEKGRDSGRRLRHTNWTYKVGILLVLVALTLAAFPRGELYQYTVQVGEEWRQENLSAPFDFPIYKSSDELQAERADLRRRTPPYFSENLDAQARMAANRDTVAQQLQRVFSAYEAYQLNRVRGRSAEAHADSVTYMERRRDARLKATPEQWRSLVESYAVRVPELPQSSREPPEGRRLDVELLEQAWELSTQLLNVGVMDVTLDSVHADEVHIRNQVDNTYQTKNKDSLYGLNEAYTYAQRRFQQMYDDRPELASLGTAFFRSIFVPSLNYMRGETVRTWQSLESRISVTRGRVGEGEVLVERGQRVTPEIRQKLMSLEQARREAGGDDILWRVLLGQFLISLATYFIFFLYLYLLRRSIFDDNKKIMLLAILFAGIIGLFAVAIRVETLAMYIVPVAIAPVLFTVMFDSRVGLFGALTLSLIGGLLLNYDFEFAFATIFASTLGVFSVRDIRNRGQFFISAGLVFLGYVVVLGSTAIHFGSPRDLFLSDLLLVGVNSFLLVVAYPLLWVFERAFDITTDLSLLELSDTNRPLLKELSLRAPGTFNHSLQVANLSEAAADAVGANALLTRVGALYHDIGKMLKPDYFVENQRPGMNPHNQLKPRMSALIIASHVKEGLEMGRQYKLPQRVLDFIPMHHGTTRIEFFYRKALDQRDEGDPEILESEFRYPGPRANSKETGILMLADSVEAASRSLSDPTHKRLETLVEMIFKARTEDGQLDKTDLTFRDLTTIKETFLSMLLGIYHVRVKYPGQDEGVGATDSTRRKSEQQAPDVPATSAGTMGTIREQGVVGTMEQAVSPPHGESWAEDLPPPTEELPTSAESEDSSPTGQTAGEQKRSVSEASDVNSHVGPGETDRSETGDAQSADKNMSPAGLSSPAKQPTSAEKPTPADQPTSAEQATSSEKPPSAAKEPTSATPPASVEQPTPTSTITPASVEQPTPTSATPPASAEQPNLTEQTSSAESPATKENASSAEENASSAEPPEPALLDDKALDAAAAEREARMAEAGTGPTDEDIENRARNSGAELLENGDGRADREGGDEKAQAAEADDNVVSNGDGAAEEAEVDETKKNE